MDRLKLSKYWLFQLAGWGSLAFINIFFAYTFDTLLDPDAVIIFFARLGIFVLLVIALTHLMRFVIINMNTLQKSFDKQILQFLLITFVFAMVGSLFNSELLIRIPRLINQLAAEGPNGSVFPELLKKGEAEILNKSYFLLILSGAFYFFIYYFIWNLIYFMYHYVSKSRKQQMDTLQLEALVKELELKTIKAHINPHFIFNALNSIRALIDENPGRARTAVTELSNILRSSLKAEKGETVNFSDEFKIVKDYLALENMRFEDRLQVEFEVDDDTMDQQVPPMMLQTLVENAIKHGISKQIKGGKIKVISEFTDHNHVLAVQNTGHLNGSVKNVGFGLSSTQDRLQLLYGEKARFQISQLDPTTVEAKILIPITSNYYKVNESYHN